MLVLKLSDPDRVRPSVARKIDADDDIEPAMTAVSMLSN